MMVLWFMESLKTVENCVSNMSSSSSSSSSGGLSGNNTRDYNNGSQQMEIV